MNNIAALENKVTETMEDEAVTELKEEVTMKQFESLNSVPSIEQERKQKQSQQSLDRVLTLHKEVMETEKLVERRTEMSHLDDQLEEKTELLKCDFIKKSCLWSKITWMLLWGDLCLNQKSGIKKVKNNQKLLKQKM